MATDTEPMNDITQDRMEETGLHVRIPLELRQAIRARAAIEGVSVQSAVARVLSAWAATELEQVQKERAKPAA